MFWRDPANLVTALRNGFYHPWRRTRPKKVSFTRRLKTKLVTGGILLSLLKRSSNGTRESHDPGHAENRAIQSMQW